MHETQQQQLVQAFTKSFSHGDKFKTGQVEITNAPNAPVELGTAKSCSEVLAPGQQLGAVEKDVAKLLHDAGLADEILKGENFHLEVENEPFVPLSIKRHKQELYLTHFLSDDGDLTLDSEMVFDISDLGQLSLSQTAVQDPVKGGELRRNDKQFGAFFSKNLLEQGFAEAAMSAWKDQVVQLPDRQDTKHLTETGLGATKSNITLEAAQPIKQQVQKSAEAKSNERLSAKNMVKVSQSSLAKQLSESDWSPEDKVVQLSLFDLGMNQPQDTIAPHNLKLVTQTTKQETLIKPSIEHLTPPVKNEPAAVSVSFVPESSHRSEPILPINQAENWSSVRQSLVQGLPTILIDRLHECGLIYADPEANAVFLHHSIGSDWQRDGATGATLINPADVGREVSHNSSQRDGWFWFSAGTGELSKAVITSSPLDALTCAVTLRRNCQEEGISVYLSVASDAVPNLALKALLERGGRVETAFNADWASEQIAQSILKKIPGAVQILPTQSPIRAKQLNGSEESPVKTGVVVQKATQSPALPQPNLEKIAPMQILQQVVDRVDKRMGDFLASSEHSSLSLDTLRQWYQVSRELGKSGKYLDRIAAVVTE